MRIAVKGSSGVIGSAIAAELITSGHEVMALSRSESSSETKSQALVCCHGDYGPSGKFIDMSYENWTAGLRLNLLEQIKEVHQFVNSLDGYPGRVVLMGGAGIGSDVTPKERTSYTVAKAGLVYFVEAVSEEMPNVSINIVAPGPVASKLSGLTSGVSPELAAKMVAWLLLRAPSDLTGRLFSARFDKLPLHPINHNQYKLRRRVD